MLDRYEVINEAVSAKYEKRKRAWAESRKSKSEKGHFPFPFHLQRILETSSSSTMMKRFMDNLPANSTLVPGLQLMQNLDYRFFVDMILRDTESKPKTPSRLPCKDVGRLAERPISTHFVEATYSGVQ